MSPPKDSERRAHAAPDGNGDISTDGQGVLSKLPRTRPQRASPRRAAARAASAAAEAATATTTAAPARSNGRPTARAKSAAARAPKRPASAGRQRVRGARARPTAGSAGAATVERAPRQGFECEPERAGGTVHPPGGAELVASAAEIVGELAKAGVSTGERLLKDFLSRLPLS
ncbi:MAG: hypothetical protein ACLPUT_10085 [Solirubrobacteraceae bacterium]